MGGSTVYHVIIMRFRANCQTSGSAIFCFRPQPEVAKRRRSKIQTWAKKISSCLIWLFRYLPTYALVKLTGFGNRCAVTLRATQLSQKQPLHWRTAQRRFVGGIFLDTELSMRRNCTDLEPLLLERIRRLGVVAYVDLASSLLPDRGRRSFMTRIIGFVFPQHHFLY